MNDLVGLSAFEELRSGNQADQKKVIADLIDLYIAFLFDAAKLPKDSYYEHYSTTIELYGQSTLDYTLNAILRKKLDYTDAEWMQVIDTIQHSGSKLIRGKIFRISMEYFPLPSFLKQLEFNVKTQPLSNELKGYLSRLLEHKDFEKKETYNSLDILVSRIQKLIAGGHNQSPQLQFYDCDLGPKVLNLLQEKDYATDENLYQLLAVASKVKGSKPSKKWMKEIGDLQDKIGLDKYRKLSHRIADIYLLQEVVKTQNSYEWGNEVTYYDSYAFIHADHQNFIKGVVWSLFRFSDKETLRYLSRVFEKSYQKIPGVGAAAASVGNACAWVLGNMRGKDGLGTLARLKLKMRTTSIKEIIDQYLEEGAKKYGVSVEELAELAIPEFGLKNGEKFVELEENQIRIYIEHDKVQLSYLKSDGTVLKSVPSALKNAPALSQKLKNIKKEIKEIQGVYSAQKMRIDQQYLLKRTWDYASFEKNYLNHGIVQLVATKLIWRFSKGKEQSDALFIQEKWVDLAGKTVDWISPDTQVELWHPIQDTRENILAWRKKIMELAWKQPIKQAFREIYIVTDAELRTGHYSNRMAAHFIKQHQFNSLAKLRDWRYSLTGAFDSMSTENGATKLIKPYGISAEYWITEPVGTEDWTESGIWNYVGTDQVRFMNEANEPIQMSDVPPLVFSEIMRDVDLFVGVCSIGNDPEWSDNQGVYREYWQSYSFGDLTEIAKTRKEILQGLLPRLKKLRDKATIDGKFLVVKGELRTYKIHIGSGNILMEPNDQYLCIVPSRKEAVGEKVFIPFEGDTGLSIVLSKAFLLAEDSKISDPTITSQINS